MNPWDTSGVMVTYDQLEPDGSGRRYLRRLGIFFGDQMAESFVDSLVKSPSGYYEKEHFKFVEVEFGYVYPEQKKQEGGR